MSARHVLVLFLGFAATVVLPELAYAQVHVEGSATVRVAPPPPVQVTATPARAPDPILVGRSGTATATATVDAQPQPASGRLVRATDEPGTGWGFNVGASLGGGLTLSNDDASGTRGGRGSFVFGMSVGAPIGLVFEPHAVGYFSLSGSGVVAPASGEAAMLTSSLLMGGVRLKLDPWINLFVDADAGWAFNALDFGGDDATINIDNGAVGHVGLGYRFFTNCEQQDAAIELGLHAQLGLGDNRVNDAIFATIGFQLDFAGQRRYSFTGSCRRQIAARLEAEAQAEYERLHPPQVVVVAEPVPEPAPAQVHVEVAAPTPVEVRAQTPAPAVVVEPAPEPEPYSPPLEIGVQFRPYVLLGSSLGAEGSIEAPAMRGGGGMGLGLITGPRYEIRADWDYVGQNTLMGGSANLHSFTLVNRLRLDPFAPFYFDVGAGYSVASSGPIDDVSSGFVGRVGAGYRFVVGCGAHSPLAFELGVEGRVGIGGNRIADGLYGTLAIPITFGYSHTAYTCVASAPEPAAVVVEPEPEVPSGPPSTGWFIRPYAFGGASLSSQGSIDGPHFRAGYGIGVGIIPSPWFDARFDFDGTESKATNGASMSMGTLSLMGRLRMDNAAPLYLDFGLGYAFAGSAPVDNVTSGLVGRAGFGYRYVAGCNDSASLAFDIGVEGRVGIGDNRVADGVYIMAALPLSASRTYATESAQCRWRAESNAREAEEERRLAAERERIRIAEERRIRLELEAEARTRGVTVEFIIEERRLAEIERARLLAEQEARERAEQAERDRQAREAWNAIGGAVNTANNVARGGTVRVNVAASGQATGSGGAGILRADGYAFVDARGAMTLHPEVVPLAQLQAASSVRIVVIGTEQDARAALSSLESYLRANRVRLTASEIRVEGPGPVRIEFEVH